MKLTPETFGGVGRILWQGEDVTDICYEADDQAGYVIVGIIVASQGKGHLRLWDRQKGEAVKVTLRGPVRIETPDYETPMTPEYKAARDGVTV